jgi:hypothetical protein
MISADLPNFRIGINLSVLYFLFSYGMGIISYYVKGTSNDLTLTLAYLAAVATLIFFIFWLVCVGQLHRLIQKNLANDYPISPNQAVWLHLIPLYDVYWLFKWPMVLAEFIKSKTITCRIPSWALGFLLLAGISLSWFNLGAGMLILYIVGFYLAEKISLMTLQNPPSSNESPQMPHSRTVDSLMVCLLVIQGGLFLIVGIYQVVYSLSMSSSSSSIDFWNFIAFLIDLLILLLVRKHHVSVVKLITWVAIIGTLLAAWRFFIFNGYSLEIYFILIYILLVILVQTNRNNFDVRPSRSLTDKRA